MQYSTLLPGAARLAELGERTAAASDLWLSSVGEYFRLLLRVCCRQLPLLEPVEPVDRGLKAYRLRLRDCKNECESDIPVIGARSSAE